MSIDLNLSVTILSAYRFQRSQEFPGVPTRQFSDWHSHKEWMRSERAKHLRMVNNYRILIDCEAEENQQQKDS